MIRRDMFRLGAAVLGAPAAAKLGETLGGVNRAFPGPADAPAENTAKAAEWSPERQALRALLDEAEREREYRREALAEPLDPDIACLRSLSANAKLRLQIARIKARRSIVRELRDRLYGNDW